MPRTVAAIDAPRSNALLVPLLRGVAIVLIVLEFLDLMGAADGSPLRVALAAIGAVACVVALWRPVAGVVLAIPAVLGTWVLGQGNVGMLPLLLTMMLVAARKPARTIVAVAAAYGALFAARYVRLDDLAGLGWDVGLLLVPLAVGLGVRSLTGRVRRGVVEIASAEERIRNVRRAERLTLSAELSSLVEDVLTSNENALARARDAVTADQSDRALAEIEESSRTALSHIRHLVTTLRGGTPDAGADSLLELVEGVEDQLVGHGHPVELDVPTTLGSLASPAHEALTEFVRAASDHALAGAEAGGECTLTLASTPRAVSASLSYPLDETAAHTDLPGVRERVVALGGSLEVRAADRWCATVTVPRRPDAPAAPERLPLRERWATLIPPGQGRLMAGLAALVGVVLFASNALAHATAGGDWRPDALWALTWAAAGVAAWSVPASIVLCVAVLAWSLVAVPFAEHLLPPEAAVIVLAGVVAARRPVLTIIVLLGWLAYVPAWAQGAPPENAAGFLLATPLLGGCIGLAVHYFTTTQSAQMQRLQQLRRAAATARDEERRHLAGELHDIVAHQLSLITVRVRADHASGSDRAETIGLVESINGSARADLGTLVRLMRSELDGGVATPDAPEWSTPSQAARAVTETLGASGHAVDLVVEADADDVDRTTQRTISRVLREGTTNILRYAEPNTPCRIHITGADGGFVVVEILSRLPRQHRTSADSTGWGLLGLRERADLTGGLFTAGEDGPSWRVRAVLPRFPSAGPEPRRQPEPRRHSPS